MRDDLNTTAAILARAKADADRANRARRAARSKAAAEAAQYHALSC